ncbi:hypothetical protein BJ508DRAFT_311826 [Ascobolus immersus RN42]|uniref:Uncharacterized protein n=1 Tax=Ascobolus immersus RN42 TaxID=1160509 RepID=A0A3N4HPI2_ASCIM|nr:hypothetical protein BJ508DRAFT_311826 [Ascobolus immersus RN42]
MSSVSGEDILPSYLYPAPDTFDERKSRLIHFGKDVDGAGKNQIFKIRSATSSGHERFYNVIKEGDKNHKNAGLWEIGDVQISLSKWLSGKEHKDFANFDAFIRTWGIQDPDIPNPTAASNHSRRFRAPPVHKYISLEFAPWFVLADAEPQTQSLKEDIPVPYGILRVRGWIRFYDEKDAELEKDGPGDIDETLPDGSKLVGGALIYKPVVVTVQIPKFMPDALAKGKPDAEDSYNLDHGHVWVMQSTNTVPALTIVRHDQQPRPRVRTGLSPEEKNEQEPTEVKSDQKPKETGEEEKTGIYPTEDMVFLQYKPCNTSVFSAGG